ARRLLGATLGPGFQVRAGLSQLGPDAIAEDRIDFDVAPLNPLFALDLDAGARWQDELEAIRKAGSSVGGVVTVEATGVPAGWGAPVYGKLDAELAAALMSINAAKGVEVGDGFAAAARRGEDNVDEVRLGSD